MIGFIRRFLFRKKDRQAEQAELEKRAEREVRQCKQRTRQTIAQTNEKADNLNRIIEENGFTLRIYAAMGGGKQ